MTHSPARQSVLVVDDEPRILTTLRDLLEEDFAVDVSSDAEQALERLRQSDVDVILSDQRMPGMTGDQFLGRARQISLAARVLITGYTDMDALINAINRGQIYAYVAKPWDPEALKATVAGAAEYHRLQSELAHERELLRALMDNIPDRIFFKDLHSRMTRVNRAQAAFLGLRDPAEAVGTTYLDYFPREWAEMIHEEDRAVFQTGVPVVDREHKLTRDGRTRWYSSTKAPVRNSRGEIVGLVSVSRDITERKQTEEALARQAEELARYNAELEQFTYVSAHDLQEPLRTAASFAQLLAHRYRGRLDPEADQYLDMIVRGATRMRQLIQDLLDYSQVAWRETEFGPADCQAAWDAAVEVLRRLIQERNAEVTAGPLPRVLGNPAGLERLFQNLIGNGLKFCSQPVPRVHVSASRQGGHWLFAVRDNGIGIEPQFADRIFTVFQRLHPRERYPGTGIGLALCKRIVERHHGRIWVESTPGQGSTFYFTLPAIVES